ncbi:MAG: hypothetical protein Q8M29_07070 [Bacteroidota bacterium]|nr:hypothetical protein [Bacteroidota bacterium]
MKSIIILFLFALAVSSCLKKKNEEPSANNPLSPTNSGEIITTMKIYIKDSVSGNYIIGSPFIFKDADGDGGNIGTYLPLAVDSLITLNDSTTYLAELFLLDETKNPVDTISNEVVEEGQDHMFFFEQTNPVGNPYSTILSGSGIEITYLDLDANNRGIGQQFKIRTNSNTAGNQHPFTITLRHQPGAKDGTFPPGETDVEVRFKVKVN